jgi:hypothetical protein
LESVLEESVHYTGFLPTTLLDTHHASFLRISDHSLGTQVTHFLYDT